MISSATSTENSREYNNMFLMNNHFSVKKSPIIDLISQSRLNNINEKALSFNKKHFTNLFRIQSKKKIYDDKANNNNNENKNLPLIPYTQKSYKFIEKSYSHQKMKQSKRIIKIDSDNTGNKMKTFFVKRLLHSKSDKDNIRNSLILTKVKQPKNNTCSNLYGLYKNNYTTTKDQNFCTTKTKYKSLSTDIPQDMPDKFKGMSSSEVKRIFLKKKINKNLSSIKNLKKEIKFYQKEIINMFRSISKNVVSIYEQENVNE